MNNEKYIYKNKIVTYEGKHDNVNSWFICSDGNSLKIPNDDIPKKCKPIDSIRPLEADYENHIISDIEKNQPMMLSLCPTFYRHKTDGLTEIVDPDTQTVSPVDVEVLFMITFCLTIGNVTWVYPSELERDIVYNRLIGENDK